AQQPQRPLSVKVGFLVMPPRWCGVVAGHLGTSRDVRGSPVVRFSHTALRPTRGRGGGDGHVTTRTGLAGGSSLSVRTCVVARLFRTLYPDQGASTPKCAPDLRIPS